MDTISLPRLAAWFSALLAGGAAVIAAAIATTAGGDPQGKASDGSRPLQGGDPASNSRARATPSSATLELPDLIVLPPRQLYLVDDGAARVLRFSTTVANAGEGPLHLAGSYDPETNLTTATQHMSMTDGSVEERVAGAFMWHPWHEHWHFEDFTLMEVWTLDAAGELDELVASTGKSTFCAIDSELYDETLPGAASEPAFGTCGQGLQGISVGWSDTYEAELSGQSVDITGLAAGRYALRCVADPDGRIFETDDANNDVVVEIEIAAGGVTIME